MEKGKKIGEILIEEGLITQEQLAICLAEQVRTKDFLGKILLKHNFITEQALMNTLSAQFNMPCYSFSSRPLDWEWMKSFSRSLVLDYRCVPVKKDDFSITMAITNPLDMRVIEKAEEEARGMRVDFVLALESEVEAVIQEFRHYLQKQTDNRF